ncbi:MAG: 2-C-methyl-D-erythritol 4-phosphate cytidylyltransferase [Eubacteriales bacterium]|nr:2-C-methyl-D-erythritol 4-phosphate cytidylyltransferase [Eubacteriales bacterium]
MAITERIRSITKKEKQPPIFSAVILAAGNSTRMGQDKIELSPGGIPVVVRAVRVFEESELVSEIILVTRGDRIQELADQIKGYGFQKVKAVIAGGATRAESSLAGVLATDKNAKLIGIHDCARPFVSQRVIRDTACAARDYYAALPVIPVTDTIKIKDGDFLGNLVDRETLCSIQTPQIFKADLIKGALTYVVKNNLPVTDDSSAVAYLGIKTRMVEGDRENIKLTTPDDLVFAEAIIRHREEMEAKE